MTVAFTLPGNVPIYAFSLLVGIGASLGIGRLISKTGPGTLSGTLAAGGIVLLFALIGSRLFYQFNHPAAAVLELPIGGLSWAGAVIGGLTGLLIASPLVHIPPGQIADSLTPLGATLLGAVWLGCWVDGCAYGAPSAAWYSLAARDEWGLITNRVPVQLTGALLALVTLVIFDLVLSKFRRSGLAFSLWLAATGAQLWWLQSLRTDPVPDWNGFRVNVIAAGSLTIAGGVLTTLSLLGPRIFGSKVDNA